MRLGVISSQEAGATDTLLSQLADRLTARGLRLAGTVQINTDCGPNKPCDMDVKVLPNGPVLRISQSLGTQARGCRLDPDVLAQAVGIATAQFEKNVVDLLIVNKFGKTESAGGGFRDLIATALSAGIPVIVGLNQLNAPEFKAFTGGIAEQLDTRLEAMEAWSVLALRKGTVIKPA